MPYEAPTSAELKARFPVFAQVAEPILLGALEEAANKVDRTWREEDFKIAQLLYAAHVLTTDGHGTGREAKFSSLAAAGIKGIKISSLSVSLGKTEVQGSVGRSTLSTTSFGKRFLDLMKVNHPAIAVT